MAAPDFVESATEVAVMVAVEGRPDAIVGAVKVAVVAPVDAIEPLDAVQVTPLLAESLVTVAVKVAVWDGQPVLFG
jgi:hypothetical protein